MRVLVVFREGPAQAARVRDGIDLALAALAFDHEVDVLFLGAGAELLRGADAELAANLRALPFHGTHAIGVDAALASDGPVFAAQPLDADGQRAWFAAATHVFAC